MASIDDLKQFAREQENIARGKLNDHQQNVLAKLKHCSFLKERYKVIATDASANDQDDVIETLPSNFDQTIEYYKNNLNDIMESSLQMNDILPFDFNNVKLDEEKSGEYYQGKISSCYKEVIDKFIKTCKPITQFCKILLDVADEKWVDKLGLRRAVFVTVNILVNLLIPVHEISTTLTQAVKEAEIRDTSAANSNDDDNKLVAQQKLKECALQIMKMGNKLKEDAGSLLDVIIDGFGLSDELRNEYFKHVENYYKIETSRGLIHFQLCSYKFEQSEKVSQETLKNYHDEVTVLKREIQNTFNTNVHEICDVLSGLTLVDH
ncbi:hypothetical protein GCK72_018572 [Caenorhabditis remanei]|uniref:Uncharacterized protein n=1 Tax=Caenorhabditis remanei TaxID=31234 RepID=A0A6A5GA53_CAERE|nr:hypothetical protein GCK72_018572 [Caenorhabditis remanei]KAF1752018.1 hypothetical protein GCK72_018572 [Caenorhabditis remanei]